MTILLQNHCFTELKDSFRFSDVAKKRKKSETRVEMDKEIANRIKKRKTEQLETVIQKKTVKDKVKVLEFMYSFQQLFE